MSEADQKIDERADNKDRKAAGRKADRIVEQLRRNTVALISLFVACTSLGYNTWRNETSEFNRNQRLVSIQMLLTLGELQQIAWVNHYDMPTVVESNARSGWALVYTIRDLSLVLKAPIPDSAEALIDTWEANWDGLGQRDASGRLVNAGNDRIQASIERVRADTQALLVSLN